MLSLILKNSRHMLVLFLSFLMLFISGAVFAASITPTGNCVIQNCVRYTLTTDDGINIRVLEWKKTDGSLNSTAPAVVFINGFPHSQLEWLPVTGSSLANGYRLITFDLRGQGLSDKPDVSSAYSNGKYAGDIQAIIDLLNLNNVVLVAHSHGGTALMDYIINNGTSDLKGIVLMGAFTKLNLADGPLTVGVFAPDALQVAPRILNDDDVGDYLAANKLFVELSSQSSMPKEGMDILAYDMTSPAKVRQAIFFPPRNVTNTALTSLPIPSMVVHGSSDKLILLSHAQENYSLLGANSELIVYPGVGHMPQYEVTNKFLKDLEAFLAKANQ